MGSLGEAASKVIESTGHAVKDSTTGIGKMFHGILAGIGRTTQWCLILVIFLVLLYINRSTFLALCRRKPSGPPNTPATPLPTPSTDTDPTRNSLIDPTSTPERPSALPLALASFTLHDASASQEKSGVVIPVTISSQHDHISCSALVDTGSPVTLHSQKLQRQLDLPATPFESHYHLFGATGDALATLGTIQVDIVSDSNIWPTPAIVVSSLACPLILRLNFLKLTKSKIDFEINNVEIRSKIYPADVPGLGMTRGR